MSEEERKLVAEKVRGVASLIETGQVVSVRFSWDGDDVVLIEVTAAACVDNIEINVEFTPENH